MSTEKIFDIITENEQETNGVVALAIRPNQPSQYGIGSLSGKDLQRHFDKLARLVIDKYNKMAGVLSSTSVTEYFNLPEDINIDGGTTIDTFIRHLIDEDGNLYYLDSDGKKYTVSEKISGLKTSLDEIQKSIINGDFKGDPGEEGKPGEPGQDGVGIKDVTIESNGNLKITLTNDQVFNLGNVKGEDGTPGTPGKDGEPGKPFKISKWYKTEQEMIDDYSNAEIEIGSFVLIETGDVNEEINSTLWIKLADVNAKYKLVSDLSGAEGIAGTDGKDGYTPYIGADGYWYINGNSTGVKAKGQNGVDGNTPYIQNGYWYIAGNNTGEKAIGTPGKSAYEIAKEVRGFEGTEDEWLSYITSSTEQISTIDGEELRFFVGTQEEYDALDNKENLFAIISDDNSVVQLDAVSNGTTYGLEYEYHRVGVPYSIVKGIGSATATDIVIPRFENDAHTKIIGASAFKDNTSIRSVRLPSGITEIGEYAFLGCTNLRLINIPATVTTIGRVAFSGCPNLTIVCEGDDAGDNWDSHWTDGALNVVFGESYIDSAKAAQASFAEWADYATYDDNGDVISETYLPISDYTAPSKILAASSNNYIVNLSFTADKIVDIIAARLTLVASGETRAYTCNINVPFVDSSETLKFRHDGYDVANTGTSVLYSRYSLYIEMSFSGNTIKFDKVISVDTTDSTLPSGKECTVTGCTLKLRYKA